MTAEEIEKKISEIEKDRQDNLKAYLSAGDSERDLIAAVNAERLFRIKDLQSILDHAQQSKPLPTDEEIDKIFPISLSTLGLTNNAHLQRRFGAKTLRDNFSQPLEQSGEVESKKQFYEYVENLGIKTNDAQRLMMLAKASEPSREDLHTEIMALRAMIASRDFDLKQLKENVRPRIKLSDASDVNELTAYIHQLWSYCTILEDDMAKPLPTDEEINLMNLTKAELIADMEAIQEENAKLTKKLDITYRDLCKEKEEMKAEKKLNEKLVFDLADAENTIANSSGRLKAETEAHERTGERLCDCEAVAISTQNKLEAYQIVHRDQTNN